MKQDNTIINPDPNTPLPVDFYVNRLELASRTTFWNWTKNGLRTFRVGGRVYVSQSDLQEFFSEFRKKAHEKD